MPPISKLFGSLYVAANGDTTDYGNGQILCDNDIIIQDASSSDTRNIKTLGSNLCISSAGLTLNPSGFLTMNSTGTSAWVSTGTLMLGNSNGTVQFGTNAVLNSVNATASVTGNTVTIANQGASQSINIGTDSNTGTVNIGDSTGTKKTINVVGAFNATGPSFSALSAGTMTINNSAASQSINLGTDSNVGTINVGSSNKTVNINSNNLTWTNGGNLNMYVTGTNTIMMENTTNSSYLQIGSAVSVQSNNGANLSGHTGVTVDSDSGVVNIGITATGSTINIGNTSPDYYRNINLFGKNSAFNSRMGTVISNYSSGDISLQNSVGAINVGNDSGTTNVNIGTALKTTNMLGYVNATGAASFNVAPAGPLTLNVSSASQPIVIGTDANAGTITLGSSSKTLAINANTTISGNLTVNGTMETFNATTTTFTDNVIALHCMPASTADSCVLFQRYGGDVVTENGTSYSITVTLTPVSSTTMSCSSIGTAANGNSLIGCFFVNNSVYVYITNVTGSSPTWTLTLSSAIGTQISAGAMPVWNRSSVGVLYSEVTANKGVNLGYYSAVAEEASGAVSANSFVGYADLRCGNIYSSAINSFQISMLSTSQTAQTLTSLNQTGSYMIIVSPTVTGNATATFMISKSAAAQTAGNVFRLTSSAGTLGTGPTYEELGVLWPATTQPQVYHATAGSQSSTTVTYNVRVVAN